MRESGNGDDTKRAAESQDERLPAGADCVSSLPPGSDAGPGAAPEASEASSEARPPETTAAPKFCITGAANSQEKGKGGLDWLAVSCVGGWTAEAWAKLIDKLDRAKLKAQQNSGHAWLDHPEGGQILVEPHGVKHGPVLAPYAIEFSGIRVHIAGTSVGTENRPNVFLQLGSLVLTQLGHVEAWAQACRLLSLWGFTFDRATPSRVDLCADMPGQSIAWYAQAV